MAASKLLQLSSTILIYSLFLLCLSISSAACNCSGGGSPPPTIGKRSPPPARPRSPPPPPPELPPPSPIAPTPPSPSTPSPGGTPPSPLDPPPICPIDTLKLGVCADLLGGSSHGVVIGSPISSPCCSLLKGLTDLQAAVCLCTAINDDVLGVHLNVQIALSLIINDCGKSVPSGYKCV